jgi:phenylpropionate dioxygenase-like ring-hydroxylating dioxygenase large terminal subunit
MNAVVQQLFNDNGSNGEGGNAVVVGGGASRQWRPGSFNLRDAWFPVAHTPHVTRRAIRREVHEQPYYLWRDGERIRAAEFPPEELAMRRSREGSEFTDGSGEYQVIERYGYAWVWYGNPRNADDALMPDVPYLPRTGKLPSHMWGTVVFDCTYELTCENLLDLTHSDFLHGKLIGESYSEDDQISVESTSETIKMVRETKGRLTPKVQKPLITTSKYQDMRATTFIHLRSGVTILYGQYEPGITVQLFHPDVPVSRHRTNNNYTFHPKGANILARNLFPLMAQTIGAQDNRMLKVQNPRYLEGGDRTDFSSRFDAAGLTYRRRFSALVDRQKNGDFSYQSDCDPGADLSKVLGCERAK